MALLCLSIAAQAPSDRLRLKVEADRKAILIGEPFLLTVSYAYPLGGAAPVVSDPAETARRFEVLERLPADSSETAGIRRVRRRYRMTGFDSGRWAVPVYAGLSGGLSVRSDSILLEVSLGPSAATGYHDIRDVRDPVGGDVPWPGLPGAVMVAVAVAAVVFLLYRRFRSRPAPTVSARHPEQALQDALQRLGRLREECLLGSRRPSEVHAACHALFREHLEHCYGLPAQTATSSELLSLLRQGWGLSPGQFSTLAGVMRMSDAVRFARYASQREEAAKACAEWMEVIRNLHPEIA